MKVLEFARLAAVALVLAAPAGTAVAGGQRPAGVVELFTSQGCNSCPPADLMFADIAAKGDVVALAYHVDYWDYLGWRDTLARPENTERQNAYMRAFGSGSVYTPQAVINGGQHLAGSSREAIEAALAASDKPGSGLSIGIDVKRVGDSIVIDTEDAADSQPVKAKVVLVFFDAPRSVAISRGENSGRTMTYWNAVTGMQTAGVWHGKATRYEFPASEIAQKGTGGCAVLLQRVANGLPGPILGAAVLAKPAP